MHLRKDFLAETFKIKKPQTQIQIQMHSHLNIIVILTYILISQAIFFLRNSYIDY